MEGEVEGKVILIVGRKKCGKTTKLLELLKPVNKDAIRLHDVSKKARVELDYNRPVQSYEAFKQECNSLSNCVFVYEEATIFIRHSPDEDLLNFLVTARHAGNTSIFIFHSLRSVPHFIWDQADFLFLYKSKDTLSLVETKFQDQELTEIYKRVNASPNPHANEFYEI